MSSIGAAGTGAAGIGAAGIGAAGIGAAGTHHRTTTPSPLSQSTSAVHLHPDDQDVPPGRKLTKRRKPFEGLFGFSPSPPAPDAASITPSTQTVTGRLFKRQSIMKSASTSSIPQTISNASIVPSEKRQKHSSLLGRFARRFSIIRRGPPGRSRGASMDGTNEWSRRERHSLQVTDRTSTTTRPPSLANHVSPSENRQSMPMQPPQAENTLSPHPTPLGMSEDEQTWDSEQPQDGKRESLSSFEVPYSIGRLTVANPDEPSSVDNTPVNQSYPLPPSKTATVSPPLPPHVVDKPLPPPVPPSPSPPVLLEIPKFESLSIPMPVTNGFATTARAPPPVTRATSGDKRKSQSTSPTSSPVPIPRAATKTDKRTSRSSHHSSTPVPAASTSLSLPAPPVSTSLPPPAPASTSLSPPVLPSTTRISVSAPPALDDSPLSRASIIANPPTPYVEPSPINNPPPPAQNKVPTINVSIPSPVVTPIVSSPHAATSPRSHIPRVAASPQSHTPRVATSPQSHPPRVATSLQSHPPHTVTSPQSHPPRVATSPQSHTPHTTPSPQSPTPAARESLPTKKQESRLPRSNSSVRTRETETFHLVRNPSAGATQHTGQSIVVAGEQWEVVGGGAQRSRSKKDKDEARRSNAEPERREPKRQERTSEKVCILSLTVPRSS